MYTVLRQSRLSRVRSPQKRKSLQRRRRKRPSRSVSIHNVVLFATVTVPVSLLAGSCAFCYCLSVCCRRVSCLLQSFSACVCMLTMCIHIHKLPSSHSPLGSKCSSLAGACTLWQVMPVVLHATHHGLIAMHSIKGRMTMPSSFCP